MTTYTVILSQEPLSDGTLVWGAFCPAMPGLVVQMPTREETLREAATLMDEWLRHARTQGFEPLAETVDLVANAFREFFEDCEAEGLPFVCESTVLAPVGAVAV